jgi:hypothetical protein
MALFVLLKHESTLKKLREPFFANAQRSKRKEESNFEKWKIEVINVDKNGNKTVSV